MTLQELLEVQGFVVLADKRRRKRGTVIESWKYHKIPGPVVVTDLATFEEWTAQCEMLGEGPADRSRYPGWWFMKVTTE